MIETLVQPTGRERTWGSDDLIVSKTDLKGLITYANLTFLQVSGYTEEELLGKQPAPPRKSPPKSPQCERPSTI